MIEAEGQIGHSAETHVGTNFAKYLDIMRMLGSLGLLGRLGER